MDTNDPRRGRLGCPLLTLKGPRLPQINTNPVFHAQASWDEEETIKDGVDNNVGDKEEDVDVYVDGIILSVV